MAWTLADGVACMLEECEPQDVRTALRQLRDLMRMLTAAMPPESINITACR